METIRVAAVSMNGFLGPVLRRYAPLSTNWPPGANFEVGGEKRAFGLVLVADGPLRRCPSRVAARLQGRTHHVTSGMGGSW